MTEEEARIIAEPVVRHIVDCMADRAYNRIPEYAALPAGISAAQLRNWSESYLMENRLRCFDHYGAPNHAPAIYEDMPYEQLNVYVYNDGAGFSAEYDLASDGELNDLILIVEFLYDENQNLIPHLEDIHVV